MLRITRVEDTTKTLHLRLDGRIVGDWVRLLAEELAQRADASRKVVLDMAGVHFASDAGLLVVRGAMDHGAQLIGCSPLISALLGRNPDGT